jgi:hypothetical protein
MVASAAAALYGIASAASAFVLASFVHLLRLRLPLLLRQLLLPLCVVRLHLLLLFASFYATAMALLPLHLLCGCVVCHPAIALHFRCVLALHRLLLLLLRLIRRVCLCGCVVCCI